ncbi:UDP-glycosyltransferase 73B3 [Striga hermonthica]|uniref:Glycosyltransferase n=1 Tax=Striga hermonthica TaxID=68872 RepID=A0A9N7MK46_STRHE|nr:UDP-glycosyltransferase 73B3 [Striga hermonthica]
MAKLHIVLFPAMSYGHLIPTLDLAKLFTSRGLRVTIITTPPFAPTVERARSSGHDIGLKTLDFPPKNSLLPKNIFSLDQVSSPDLLAEFFEATALLRDPLERLLLDLDASCLVSGIFLPWTAGLAKDLGIPRLVFHGWGCFALCASEHMHIHEPHKSLSSDSDTFVLPGLPHELTFVRSQAPSRDQDSLFSRMKERMRETDRESFGVVVNSFYELEPDYADHYKNVLGLKTWHVGPLFLLCNDEGDNKEKSRGKESDIDEHEYLTWLDSKKPDSVVYVCFGSMVTFTRAQHHEMAAGLETSGHDFVWAVRHEGKEDPLPEGFEERMSGKGLVIRGWAPQVTILGHEAVGAFVTHCGWNSALEGVCAGVPMVTWPAFAEQFYNEKLLTEVLRVGVPVGSKKWERVGIEGVGQEAVRAAVQRVMADDEMRQRTKDLKVMAKRVVAEGGSSYEGLNALIDELRVYVPS